MAGISARDGSGGPAQWNASSARGEEATGGSHRSALLLPRESRNERFGISKWLFLSRRESITQYDNEGGLCGQLLGDECQALSRVPRDHFQRPLAAGRSAPAC